MAVCFRGDDAGISTHAPVKERRIVLLAGFADVKDFNSRSCEGATAELGDSLGKMGDFETTQGK